MNELPQEIDSRIQTRISQLSIHDDTLKKTYLYNMELGAFYAADHYAPIIAEKDKVITDLQKKVAELEAKEADLRNKLSPIFTHFEMIREFEGVDSHIVERFADIQTKNEEQCFVSLEQIKEIFKAPTT